MKLSKQTKQQTFWLGKHILAGSPAPGWGSSGARPRRLGVTINRYLQSLGLRREPYKQKRAGGGRVAFILNPQPLISPFCGRTRCLPGAKTLAAAVRKAPPVPGDR